MMPADDGTADCAACGKLLLYQKCPSFPAPAAAPAERDAPCRHCELPSGDGIHREDGGADTWHEYEWHDYEPPAPGHAPMGVRVLEAAADFEQTADDAEAE